MRQVYQQDRHSVSVHLVTLGLSMASALQYCFAMLMLVIPIYECDMVFQDGKCIKEEPCFDLTAMASIAEIVSKNVIAADGEKILLKHSSFDKIRRKKTLHSCVLQKIIDLFHDVLIETEGRSDKETVHRHSELINIMDQLRSCVYEVKGKCNKLFRDLGWPDKKPRKTTTSPTTVSEKEMNPKQLAVLQLEKLMYARERLKNVHIQERVMDELKTLHLYMNGKGFRKNTND